MKIKRELLRCLLDTAHYVAQLTERVNQMEVDIEGLKTTIQEQGAEIDAQKVLVESQGVILNGIAQDYATLLAQNAAQQTQIDAQLAQIEALQAALNNNDPAAIQAKINEVKAMAESQKTKLQENRATLQASQNRMVALDESVAPPVTPNP
jgi:chromosome segregation ATPase